MVQPSHRLSDAKRMRRPRALSLTLLGLDWLVNKMGPDSYASSLSMNVMAGVLPASMIMTRRLQALGYVEGKVVREKPVVATGKTIRGHEFRYSRMDRARDAGSHTGSPWARGSWTTRTNGAERAGELPAHSCVFVSDG